MALADSKQAIGAVSELLKSRLTLNTSASTVDIGRPEAATANNCPKLNLFLYQVDIDGQLRNHPLDQGQAPPIWLVLHYLLTAFDKDKESDSSKAHELLGEGMLTLQEMNFAEPASPALADNPEPLKITFNTADSELLSKIMQGSDEKYRLSVSFQVRPVMIVPSVPPHYALPVKTVGPPADEGAVVVPSLGPRLEGISPDRFTIGDTIALTGLDIGTETEMVRIGNYRLPVTTAKDGEIKTVIAARPKLSAGSYPVTAIRLLPDDRELSSNALLGHLLPKVTNAQHGVLTTVAGKCSGNLILTGNLLGGADDSIFVAFYQKGEISLMLQVTGTAAQTTLTVTVDAAHALEAGTYYIILRVNGEQAANAPKVEWT
jgi:hypothetical protein